MQNVSQADFVKLKEEFALYKAEAARSVHDSLKKIDSDFKNFILKNIETSEIKFSNLNVKLEHDLKKYIDSQIKAQEDSIRQALRVELNTTLFNLQSSIEKSIIENLYGKIAELEFKIASKVNNDITQTQKAIQSQQDAFIDSVNARLECSLSCFKSDLSQIVGDIVHDSILKVNKVNQNTTKDIVDDHTKYVLGYLADLKDFMIEQLDQKFIDKTAINSKFLNIEQQMQSKLKNMIAQQLDQARNSLEQTARAQIQETLKEFK